MKTWVDARLLVEAERFAFRFACDDCAHFDSEGVRCSLEYPAAPRRGALDNGHAPTRAAPFAVAIELCKSFELG